MVNIFLIGVLDRRQISNQLVAKGGTELVVWQFTRWRKVPRRPYWPGHMLRVDNLVEGVQGARGKVNDARCRMHHNAYNTLTNALEQAYERMISVSELSIATFGCCVRDLTFDSFLPCPFVRLRNHTGNALCESPKEIHATFPKANFSI